VHGCHVELVPRDHIRHLRERCLETDESRAGDRYDGKSNSLLASTTCQTPTASTTRAAEEMQLAPAVARFLTSGLNVMQTVVMCAWVSCGTRAKGPRQTPP
jgi:hypothetical protein